MAQLDVEPKKNNDWWKWVVGILAAILIIWLIVEATGSDDVDTIDDVDDMETATGNQPTTFIQPDTKYSFS